MSSTESAIGNKFLRRYLQDFSWVAAGIGAALAIDFVFYILAGRLMSPVEFGYFGVLTSLYYIFLRSPFRTVEVVSKKISAEGGNSLKVMGRMSLIAGVLMFLLFKIFSEPISALLGLPEMALVIFSLIFPVGYYLAVLVGKIQGEKNYQLYGAYEFLSSLIAFSAIILVYLGFGAAGAVTVFVIEIVIGFLVLHKYEDFKLDREEFTEHRLLKNSFIYVAAVHIAFSLDILMVQHFFSSETTGFYSTVAVLGKGLFFGAVAVNRSVFPKFVTDEADRFRNLQLSQLLVALGGIFSALFFYFFGEIFIAYTFGYSYLEAASYAPHYMIMITGISSTALAASYCISTDIDVRPVILLPVLQLILTSLFHETVLQIVYSTFIASVFTVLFLSSRILESSILETEL